jgi:plasmid stabilization system protein ParE
VAAQRAVKTIRQGVKALGKHPEAARPVEELPPEFREWLIEFGQGACVALYWRFATAAKPGTEGEPGDCAILRS